MNSKFYAGVGLITLPWLYDYDYDYMVITEWWLQLWLLVVKCDYDYNYDYTKVCNQLQLITIIHANSTMAV